MEAENFCRTHRKLRCTTADGCHVVQPTSVWSANATHMLVSALGPQQKTLFGAASPRCGLAGSEWHDTWKGSLRNEHTITALLWDPPICNREGGCLPHQRPSAKAVEAGARHWALTTASLESSNMAPPSIPDQPSTGSDGRWGRAETTNTKPSPRKTPTVNAEKPLKSNLEDGCVGWTLSSAWQTGPAWLVTSTSPITGMVLLQSGSSTGRQSTSACPRRDQGLRQEEGKKDHPWLSQVWH